MRIRRLCLLFHAILLSGFSIEHLFVYGLIANWVLNEPRPAASVIEDMSITHQISQKLSNDLRYKTTTNVRPISYNQIVLLVGQVPNEALKKQAQDYATHTPKVARVFNQMTISTPTNAWRRLQDGFLSNLIAIKLSMTSHVRYHHFKIAVEDGEVFILGKATPEEAHLAAITAQGTSGIKKVLKLVAPPST
jgi:osmotically-inducible protein OsmY